MKSPRLVFVEWEDQTRHPVWMGGAALLQTDGISVATSTPEPTIIKTALVYGERPRYALERLAKRGRV